MIFAMLVATAFSFSTYRCDTTATPVGQRVQCREWSKKTKKIISDWSWLNGKPDGLCEEWFENGKTRLRHKYRSGLMVDTSIEYFSSGKVAGTYSCDSSGKFCQWKFTHENGRIARQGQSRLGKTVGTVKTFHASGVIESLENYDPSGVRDGIHAYWSSRGILRDSIFYTQGNITFNVHRDTNTNQDVCRWRERYDSNTRSVVEAECFDPHGASSGKVIAGTGEVTYFAPNGKPSGKEVYLNGFLVKEVRFSAE